MGLFQAVREAHERAKCAGVASLVFKEAPVAVIDVIHSCFGRPALAYGLGRVGAGSDGDIEGKMQVFLKGAKAGDVACERALRSIMQDAAYRFANTNLIPIELINGVTSVLQEIQRRKYVLDDSFDPMAITLQNMPKNSPAANFLHTLAKAS